MGEITFAGFDVPRNRRPRPEGDLVDLQGWLTAPVDWDPAELEHLWNTKHGLSRLHVGLCVANNPKRHFLLSNVIDDLDAVRAELESLIAELTNHEPTSVSADSE